MLGPLGIKLGEEIEVELLRAIVDLATFPTFGLGAAWLVALQTRSMGQVLVHFPPRPLQTAMMRAVLGAMAYIEKPKDPSLNPSLSLATPARGGVGEIESKWLRT